VDEDLASRELLRRLDDLFPGEIVVSARGSTDEAVWEHAQREAAAILTANVVDFIRLAEERPDHHGLLLVIRRNDPTKDLRAAGIATRVVSITGLYPDGLRRLALVVNSVPLAEGSGA
jgi:Domain of unknown function (DUF5615)